MFSANLEVIWEISVEFIPGNDERSGSPRVCVWDKIDHLPPSHVELLQNAERRDFFQGLGWFKSFMATALEDNARPAILSVENDEGLLLLVCLRSPEGQNGSIFARNCMPLKSLASMTNFQSIYFAPVHSNNHSTDAVIQMGRELKRLRCPLINFDHLDPRTDAVDALSGGFSASGFRVRAYDYDQNLFERTDGISYADYLKNRSSQLRNNIRRMRKKLAKLGEVRFECTSRGDLGNAIRDYKDVLANSWKEPEPFPDHTASMINEAANAGSLRLGLRSRSITGINVVTSAVSPGHNSEQTGRPSWSMTTPTIIWLRSGR